MKSEWEKAQAGERYNAMAPELVAQRAACAERCHEYNNLSPTDVERQQTLLRALLGQVEGSVAVMPPFHCDYGTNICVGDGFYANFNCTILDEAPVTFGRRVLVGPNCTFSTAAHPLDAALRATGVETARPIVVGDDVWFGACVTVLPGVTIGNGTVIGAGSVVTRSIPSGVVAVGNPCRVLRAIAPSATPAPDECEA